MDNSTQTVARWFHCCASARVAVCVCVACSNTLCGSVGVALHLAWHWAVKIRADPIHASLLQCPHTHPPAHTRTCDTHQRRNSPTPSPIAQPLHYCEAHREAEYTSISLFSEHVLASVLKQADLTSIHYGYRIKRQALRWWGWSLRGRGACAGHSNTNQRKKAGLYSDALKRSTFIGVCISVPRRKKRRWVEQLTFDRCEKALTFRDKAHQRTPVSHL